MKKSFVVLLIVLALVVLISPGIIGRIAEQSVDDSLDWAASDNDNVVVTSTGFKRGWFTSAGQHRIELREGDLRTMLFGAAEANSLPALIIDTRLDHGLIPVSSMARDHGTLIPGLGSAISTLSIELTNGPIVDLPGTIFSNVGLTGELKSNFVLEPEGVDAEGVRLDWGRADFVVASDPADGTIGIKGKLGSLAAASDGQTVIVDTLELAVDHTTTPFGFTVGPARITVKSFATISATDTTTVGPIYLDSDSEIDDGRLNADVTFRVENAPMRDLGSATIEIIVRFENVDATALARLQRNANASMVDVESELQNLLASGLVLHVEQFDFELPMGTITSRFSAVVSESDARDFTWASVLLSLDASADISLPVDFVDRMTELDFNMHAPIAMGFLLRKGDYYTMQATFKQGALTVNGAPMPIPMPGMQ